MVVGENSAAEKAGMLKQSKILKVNDIEIKPGKHFQEVYGATSAPLRLTLAQLKSVSEAPSVQLPQEDSKSALSRSDLVGLILVLFSPNFMCLFCYCYCWLLFLLFPINLCFFPDLPLGDVGFFWIADGVTYSSLFCQRA